MISDVIAFLRTELEKMARRRQATKGQFKLYEWKERDCYTRAGHWIVDYDVMRDRILTVAFPFNFPVSAFVIARRTKWRVESWIFKLEITPYIESVPISFETGEPETAEAKAASEMLVRYGYERRGDEWVRIKHLRIWGGR